MESVERKIEEYAVVLNINLVKATLKEAVEFRNYFEEAVKSTDKDIIVNLSTCEYLDSTFLGILVKSYKRLKTQNRTIAIIEPVNQSSIFLTLNSIGKIFPIYSSVKVALDDIENKRLFESELKEAAAEQDVSDSSSKFVPSVVSMQNSGKESGNQSKEIIVEEFETDQVIIDSDLEISEEPIIIPDAMKERTWNLMGKEEIEFENSPARTSETEVIEESLQNEEEFKDTLEYEESHSDQGNIKWEFGFSS